MRESKRLFIGVNRLEKIMTLRLIQSYPSLREVDVRILGRIHVWLIRDILWRMRAFWARWLPASEVNAKHDKYNAVLKQALLHPALP